jgi:hypothetical protein
MAHLACLDRRTQVDRMMADAAHEAAREALMSGDASEVLRLLDLSYHVLETATADRQVRLRGVRVCARLSDGLAPTDPLVPRDFRLPDLRALAALASVAHSLAFGASARFMVKARAVSFGFALVRRTLRRARSREALADALARFEEAKADWERLDAVHVEMVRELILPDAGAHRDVVAARS